MKKPIKVTITGARGNISYALLFRIASGDAFGKDQPITLSLLEVPGDEKCLNAVVMELDDCAFPLLHDIQIHFDARPAFTDADYAILVGAKPRTQGMERKDLIAANGKIFSEQGRIINECASRDIRVLVVGNPANTNALIAAKNAPDLDPTQFTCLLRLDHTRAISAVAKKTNVGVSDISRFAVWGNHSSTQFPDLSYCMAGEKPVLEMVDGQWFESEFMPFVQKRGAQVIQARGASSAASAANAIIAHMHDWVSGAETNKNTWTSMGVYSDGSHYGIAGDLMYSFPVTCGNGQYTIVPDLPIDDRQRKYMDITMKELIEERDAVAHLLRT